MKNTKKRALRRHHRQRMIQRAYRSYALSGIDDPERKRLQVLRWHDNMAICSCYMCGNPRRTRKELDAQELRLNEAARYELREFGL